MKVVQIPVPVKVLDESCIKCVYMDIQVNGIYDIWADNEIAAREIDIQCSHVGLCQQLRKKIDEARKDGEQVESS